MVSPNLGGAADVESPVDDARPLVAPALGAGFDEVFQAHYPPLVRALTAACGDAEVAADSVQEAFVRAHLRWKLISRYEDPVAWVRRVAINSMRDYFRHESRGAKVRALLAADPQWVDEPTSDDAVEMLATLPPQQRLAMSLYYIEGLSVAEVARAMLISVGAVKFHMNQGRERLRPTLVGAD